MTGWGPPYDWENGERITQEMIDAYEMSNLSNCGRWLDLSEQSTGDEGLPATASPKDERAL